MADLQELYFLNKVADLSVRPVPTVPQDAVLAKLMHNHPDKVYKYHIHDSLLEDKPGDALTDEQKVAAWTRYTTAGIQNTNNSPNLEEVAEYDKDGVLLSLITETFSPKAATQQQKSREDALLKQMTIKQVSLMKNQQIIKSVEVSDDNVSEDLQNLDPTTEALCTAITKSNFINICSGHALEAHQASNLVRTLIIFKNYCMY